MPSKIVKTPIASLIPAVAALAATAPVPGASVAPILTQAQIDAQRAELTKQLSELAAHEQAAKHETIKRAAAIFDSLPQQLADAGFPCDLKGAFAHLRLHVEGRLASILTPFAPVSNGTELSADKKAMLKTALEARFAAMQTPGATIESIKVIAQRIGCSEQSVQKYGKDWRLNRNHLPTAVSAPFAAPAPAPEAATA